MDWEMLKKDADSKASLIDQINEMRKEEVSIILRKEME
ncbi:hypothetical protein J2Z69_003378 [Paenibacillus shirakamiensis]|uniref:Uncharacterized protein n=1 Tax=Paenibacillus shirakamiensis TaxID=1265935 RepID=A0ABS4JMF7_9BACL|nr:hypothetical protein [Paenibacillus shirakamiensis]